MAEEAIPPAADPLQPRVPPTRLPSLAELYAAQQLGQSLPSNSYTLPELYALEQTGAPLDLTPSPDTSSPQKSQSPAPQSEPLPILADQIGAPLQPEPLTPGERIGGAARAAGQGATGGLSDYLEALGRTAFGVAPKSTQALREASEGFDKVGKVPSAGYASLSDHLADVQTASREFGKDSPAQATAAWLSGVAATGLLGRLIAGERLVAPVTARAAPEPVAQLASRFGPEFSKDGATTASSVAAKAEPAAAAALATEKPAIASVLTQAEPAAAAKVVPQTEQASNALARPRAVPDRSQYSVLYETELKPKSPGTGLKGHFREANENLLQDMERYPDFARMLEDEGVYLKRTPTGLAPDKPPPGWTWHHHPERNGIMQLMPRSQHEAPEFRKLLHPFPRGGGGNRQWGPGYVQVPGASAGTIWSLRNPDVEYPDSSGKQAN